MFIPLYISIFISYIYLSIIIQSYKYKGKFDTKYLEENNDLKNYLENMFFKSLFYTIIYLITVYYLCKHNYTKLSILLIIFPIIFFLLILLALRNFS